MDEYLILMRLDLITKGAQPSPEQLQQYMQQYQDWVATLTAQGRFVSGTGLSTEGRVLKAGNVVLDGPFAETKEALAGFITIRARDFDEAMGWAQACPILRAEGNSVEVRRISTVHEPE
ncbi:YciI family protein [Hymenobacter negativus]|uniref:Transcription initiation protein n=1 Tax=Hymenobacter negativus TaxID=2795026 RepID=A0ABS3QNU8_9BACT|nr:YciI family protein [Hymenobacter negativus]MBO2012960.1 transcription initiation protein [Hymenobacter negativus]